MTHKKFAFCVFIICAFYVHVSDCQDTPGSGKTKATKAPKPKKEQDKTGDTPSTYNKPPAKAGDEPDKESGLSENIKYPPMPFITYPPYTFEGVDYDELPPETKTTYFDCYGQHANCIRDRVYFYEVCTYNTSGKLVGFANHCGADLHNCLYRVKKKLPMYGNTMQDDNTFLAGDGLDCSFHGRSGNRPEDAATMFVEGEPEATPNQEYIEHDPTDQTGNRRNKVIQALFKSK